MDTGSLARLALTIAGGGVAAAVLVTRTPARPPTAPPPGVTAVLGVLPGGNCGACGNPSCFATAEAIAAGRAAADACVAGGPVTARAVAAALALVHGSPPGIR